MEQLKQDIYDYFLPMSSDSQTAAIVTYDIMTILNNHLSEYTSLLERSFNIITELQDTNAALQQRSLQIEETFLKSVRLAYDIIRDMEERRRAEERLDDLEKLQKEL